MVGTIATTNIPKIPGYDIIRKDDEVVENEDTMTALRKAVITSLETEVTTVQVAVIGDIHGTNKFIDGYEHILKNNNQVDKIIVMGDHFDPYDDISFDTMVWRYEFFTECMKTDDRIVSLLGNHDLARYVIWKDQTSRSEYNPKKVEKIRELITKNLPYSRLIFEYGNYLFSHAGVSDMWVNDIAKIRYGYKYKDLKKVGWEAEELCKLAEYYHFDYSGWGNNPFQNPTWIRPISLCECPYGDFDQVVGHTMVCKEDVRDFIFPSPDRIPVEAGGFWKVKMDNGKDLWFTDNDGKPEYLVLEILKTWED